MSAEQQLERSVLERKERDELHAIAEAMGLRPASRTKKSDLIDGILAIVTGGADSPAEAEEAPAPRRTRSPRAARAVEAAEAEETTGDPSDEDPSAETNGNAGDDTSASEVESAEPRSETDDETKASASPQDADAGESSGRGGDGQSGEGGEGFEGERFRSFEPGEGGNRRNRRRRGRDRLGDRSETQGGAEQPYQGEPVPVKGLLDLRDESLTTLVEDLDGVRECIAEIKSRIDRHISKALGGQP